MAKIAIDIDDTLTDTSASIRKCVEEYANDYEEGHILTERKDTIIRGFFDHDVIVQFFLDHGKELANNAEVREDAKEIIEKLREEGHEIIFLTARSDMYYTDAQKFCEDYLNRKNVPYDRVITGKTFKIQACKEENIDIMIDDGVDTCADLNKAGIKALLYTTECNISKNTISPRVRTWKEVYEKIHEYLDNKNK